MIKNQYTWQNKQSAINKENEKTDSHFLTLEGIPIAVQENSKMRKKWSC